MKKAQITIFIILAVIILAAIASFLFFNNQLSNQDTIAPEIAPLYSFVQSCITTEGEQALKTIGRGGGYYSVDYGTEGGTPYYFDKGKKLIPTKSVIEKELALYMDDYLQDCIKNFSTFSEFNITQAESTTKVDITDKEVIFNVRYPLTVEKSEKKFVLENFQEKIFVRLGVIYNAIQEYAVHPDYTPDEICLSCLYEISQKNDLVFDLYDYDNETILFVITDKNSLVDKEEYTFRFAGKYLQKEQNEN